MHESEKSKWSSSVMSHSLQPHGLQPTMLLCPWDFPGKSTGGGCHRLPWVHYIVSTILLMTSSSFYTTNEELSFFQSISSVKSLSLVRLCVTPWTAECQASMPVTKSWNLLKLMYIKSMMPSNDLILCHPLLWPSIFPSITVFSRGSYSHQVAKILEFQLYYQSFQWIFRTNFF